MQTNQDMFSKVVEINAAWNKAFNAKQADVVASFYADGACVMPAGAPQVTGNAEIKAFWGNVIGMGFTDHAIEAIEVRLDQNLAVQRAKWSAAAVGDDGQKQTYGGSLQVVYAKQTDGSWKVLSHIWN